MNWGPIWATAGAVIAALLAGIGSAIGVGITGQPQGPSHEVIVARSWVRPGTASAAGAGVAGATAATAAGAFCSTTASCLGVSLQPAATRAIPNKSPNIFFILYLFVFRNYPYVSTQDLLNNAQFHLQGNHVENHGFI